jgi:VanZ family protein
MKKPALWWSFAWMLVAAVTVASLVRLPAPSMELPGGFDKWEHISAYGSISFYFSQLIASNKRLLRYCLGFFAMGAALELLQGLTSYRSMDWHDLIANSIGIAAGFALAQTPLRRLLSALDHACFGQTSG